MKKWTRNCHTGVVDQSGQRGRAELCAHLGCSSLYDLSVRYIHDQERKASPNSRCRRSASLCRRTLPNTVKPFAIRTFVMPHPIPVETPVTTTLCLSAIHVRNRLDLVRYFVE